jgi:hypothetical protein
MAPEARKKESPFSREGEKGLSGEEREKNCLTVQ